MSDITTKLRALLEKRNAFPPETDSSQSLTAGDVHTIAEALLSNLSAIDGKVDKVSGKGLSTNDFTNALKEKLTAMPAIALSGNILTIDGQQFTLTPAGGGGDSTAKDYFVGWTTGSKADFAALTAAQLEALATGYSTAQNPTYTGQFGQNRIFFLLYKTAPQRIVLTSSGQEMVQNIEQDNTCPHDPVTIDGTTYQLFGIFASSQHDASDSMTITF